MILSRAKEQSRRNMWQPPTPEEVFRLAQNQQNRLVEGADQLLEIVGDALRQLQQKLHAETPAAQFLWDKDRPKDEDGFSNWVKIELQHALVRKGVVLNREVQIHFGERTDIHVDAIIRSGRTKELDQIKVIIESKGCWNPELRTAMQTQLASRYLEDNDCKHGIYLVGWFMCDAWSNRDTRKKNVKFKNLEEICTYMAKQADSLSSSGYQIKAEVLDVSIPSLIKRRRSRKLGRPRAATPKTP